MRLVYVTATAMFFLVVMAALIAPAAYADNQTVVASSTPDTVTTPVIPATTVWKQRRQSGSVLYFLDNTSTRLRRFDFTTSSWLSDITLTGTADLFDVDASGIYVKFANRVEKVAIDGSNSMILPSVVGTEAYIEVAGEYLLLGGRDNSSGFYLASTYKKTTGALVSNLSIFNSLGGTSAIKSEGRLYGVTRGTSPADVVVIEFNPSTGMLNRSFDSPYHGRYPAASTAYAREAGGMVVASAGTVYKSSTLEYLGSLGGSVQGAAFLADRFVVIRDGQLAVFSNDIQELGQLTSPAGLQDVVAHQGTPYSISGAIDSLSIQPLSLESIAEPPPPAARSWAEAVPKADVILDGGNSVVLASKIEHAAYTFDPDSWSHVNVTPLYANPLQVTFSPLSNIVYAGYAGGAIYGFSRASSGLPRWLAATPYSAQGLATAGEYVFAADSSGAWASHFSFSPSGALLSNPEWNYLSRQYEWDPVTRRMYYFSDAVSPNNIYWEQIALDGSISARGQSSISVNLSPRLPIRIAPDGSRVFIGSGQMFDSGALSLVGSLNSTIADVGWLNGDTYAISDSGAPELRRYNAAYQVVQTGRVRGTPRRILPTSDGFLYVADVGSSTILGRLDGLFAKADLAVDPVPMGALFAGGSQISLSVSVGNNGTVPSNNATVNADLSSLGNASWRCVPGTFVTGCDNTLVNGSINDAIDLADGGQTVYQITGVIPAAARNELRIVMSINPCSNTSDPEPRNNTREIVLRLDRMFDHGFD